MYPNCETCRALAGLLGGLEASMRLYNIMVVVIIIAALIFAISCVVDIFRGKRRKRNEVRGQHKSPRQGSLH
jgi:uncharacterized membrane protein